MRKFKGHESTWTYGSIDDEIYKQNTHLSDEIYYADTEYSEIINPGPPITPIPVTPELEYYSMEYI